MIDTEHVKCDTCTAPEPMELDASDEASRCWPTVDIETNPLVILAIGPPSLPRYQVWII